MVNHFNPQSPFSELLFLNTISDRINLVEDGSFGDCIKEQYAQCFKGIGKLKDRQLKIRLDPNVRPVARGIPYGGQSKVRAKLDELESL